MTIDREAILDRWARRDAVKAIAAESGNVAARLIYRIVEEARAAGDPRAAHRIGRPSEDRPSLAKPTFKSERRARRLAMNTSATLEPFGIFKRTIVVTRLGLGSADCLRMPISVSCLSTERECHHG